MNFEMTCSHCSGVMEMDEDWIGMEGECPSCGGAITIQKTLAVQNTEPLKVIKPDTPASFSEHELV
jgi:rRNA maturation endonuclease Nob1